MAASQSRVWAPHSVYRSSRKKAAMPPPVPESSSESDTIYVNEVRGARARVYSRTPEVRVMDSGFEMLEATHTPEARQRGQRSNARSNPLSGVLNNDGEAPHHPHPHHRRRRKKRRSTESDEDFVYERVQRKPRAEASPWSGEKLLRPVATQPRTSSAPTPERVQILRTLGLETPKRSKSHRTRKSSLDYLVRTEVGGSESVSERQRGKDVESTVDPEPSQNRPRRSVS